MSEHGGVSTNGFKQRGPTRITTVTSTTREAKRAAARARKKLAKQMDALKARRDEVSDGGDR